MFWLRNKKIILNYALLSIGPTWILNISRLFKTLLYIPIYLLEKNVNPDLLASEDLDKLHIYICPDKQCFSVMV